MAKWVRDKAKQIKDGIEKRPGLDKHLDHSEMDKLEFDHQQELEFRERVEKYIKKAPLGSTDVASVVGQMYSDGKTIGFVPKNAPDKIYILSTTIKFSIVSEPLNFHPRNVLKKQYTSYNTWGGDLINSGLPRYFNIRVPTEISDPCPITMSADKYCRGSTAEQNFYLVFDRRDLENLLLPALSANSAEERDRELQALYVKRDARQRSEVEGKINACESAIKAYDTFVAALNQIPHNRDNRRS